MVKIQKNVIWIQTASLFMLKQKIFKTILQKMLKQGLALQILNQTLPKGKNKKLIGLMKDQLGGQIMKELVGLRAKTYNYLKDNNEEDKKAKEQKSVS